MGSPPAAAGVRAFAVVTGGVQDPAVSTYDEATFDFDSLFRPEFSRAPQPYFRQMRDTKDPNHIYSTTWFDMFRIDDHGMIAEHWDPSPLWIDGKPPGAEFLP